MQEEARQGLSVEYATSGKVPRARKRVKVPDVFKDVQVTLSSIPFPLFFLYSLSSLSFPSSLSSPSSLFSLFPILPLLLQVMPQPSPPPFMAGRSSVFAYGCPKPVADPLAAPVADPVAAPEAPAPAATTRKRKTRGKGSKPANLGWGR